MVVLVRNLIIHLTLICCLQTITMAASISGTVFHSDNITPVTGDTSVKVEVYEHQNSAYPIISSSINTADGTYLINGLSAGEYDLRAISDNYIDEYWASAKSEYYRYLGEKITLSSQNEHKTGVNFQLDSGTPISGTVYRTNGTTPLNNIGVCAYNDSSCGKMWDFCTESNIDGTYTVRLPDGIFYLDAGGGTSYIPEWWSGDSSVRNCTDASKVIVSNGQPVSGKDFQLEEGVIISGTIFSDNGTPIIGDPTISVGVVRNNPCEPQGAAYSLPIDDHNGTYELLVEPGTYYLDVWADNYIDEWWHSSSSVYSCTEAEQISVQLGTPANHKDFQLERGAVISGTIFKHDGRTPLTKQDCLWIDVTSQDACQYNDQGGFTTPVDPNDGTYMIHVPSGTYHIMANTCNWFSNEWWATPFSVSTESCEMAGTLTVTVGNTYPNINFQIGSGFSWELFLPAIIGHVKDCNGVKRGSAYIDNCGICVGGTTGKTPCIQDCNGVWGGPAIVDECGICGGSGAPCPSCSLTCSSTGFSYSCGSSSYTTHYEYCSEHSSQIKGLLYDYGNGHTVHCVKESCTTAIYTCTDNTGQSCTIQ